MEYRSAPRKRKRISCELIVDGRRFTGIVLDVSATGIFVQTSVKPDPGSALEVKLRLPGGAESVAFEARVARQKVVPVPLLSVVQGGIGLVIPHPPEAYLAFIAELSPLCAKSVEEVRAKKTARRAPGAGSATGTAHLSGRGGGDGAAATSRFRIHLVEIASGRKNTFLATSASEQEARDQVAKQLGDEWQVLFIERV